MSSIFHFKQFSVNQNGCAMKVNTDGVLLGALAAIENPATILDIGAGTGVIALMLAQRFKDAKIEAVEIDPDAASTAKSNFGQSPFAERLTLYASSFGDFFIDRPEEKYDLVISNPPFFLNSLKSETPVKETARHTDAHFFRLLFLEAARHLTDVGRLTLILPVNTAKIIAPFAVTAGLHLQNKISILSFPSSVPHREIVSFGREKAETLTSKFIIYNAEKIYSEQYKEALGDFLTIF